MECFGGHVEEIIQGRLTVCYSPESKSRNFLDFKGKTSRRNNTFLRLKHIYYKESMTKNRVSHIIAEELLKKDVLDMFKDDKTFEKRVSEIVRKVIKDMYRVLWQHNSIFNTLGNSLVLNSIVFIQKLGCFFQT